MKQSIYTIILGVALTIMLVGCGDTQRLLKSGDNYAIYDGAMDLYEKEQWSRAATLFEAVTPYFSGTSREDSLSFYVARCRFKDRDYYEAIDKLNEFRSTFGRSAYLEDAEGMLALSYYYLSPSAERDQKNTYVAISSIEEFISRNPQSSQIETFEKIRKELVQKLHDKSYLNAYTYYKIGKYKSAIVALRNAMKEYPESSHREEMMYYILRSAYELASNSIQIKETDRYLELVDVYYSFISEFPESKYRKDVDRMAERAKSFLERSNPDLVKDAAPQVEEIKKDKN
ncbi:MAG: outer membrane protein assembly factor BamD [Rikenellaceae bacterium]